MLPVHSIFVNLFMILLGGHVWGTMLLNIYIALAIIFAAKTIIREEDIKKNSLFFLTGTMVNVTYSTLVGAIIKVPTGL
jgi:uncharacterized membrane protein